MYVRPTSSYGSLIPGSEYIRSLVRQGKSSPGAAKRLRWFDHYARFENARLTCRYFGISAQTFYRWKRRFDPYDLSTLEEGSRRPLGGGVFGDRPRDFIYLKLNAQFSAMYYGLKTTFLCPKMPF